MLWAASIPTVTRSLPLQLKCTAHTPLVWKPCITDNVSLDTASHTWTQGSVPIWPVATIFCKIYIWWIRTSADNKQSHSAKCFPVFRYLTLAPVTCFPALGTGYMFSRAWHRLHVFPRLAPVACFPALDAGCMFSRAWHWLHVFPRLTPVACFPALGTGYMFSRTWDCLYVSRAWHQLHVFRNLAPFTCFDWGDNFQLNAANPNKQQIQTSVPYQSDDLDEHGHRRYEQRGSNVSTWCQDIYSSSQFRQIVLP